MPVQKRRTMGAYSIEDEVEGRNENLQDDFSRSFVLDLKMRFQCARIG